MEINYYNMGGDALVAKVVLFLVVQALVYLILSNSSDIFSRRNKLRSFSFKPARSSSIRRILAVISDLPTGGEQSPTSMSSSSRSFRRSDSSFSEQLSSDDLLSS